MESLSLVERYIEAVWNRGDLDAFERLAAPGFTYTLAGQPPRGRAGMREMIEMTRAAFPDWCVTVLDAVSDGERVAVRWEGRVTHEGDFYGIPASGRRVSVCGMNMYRVADGAIVAEWEQMDSLGLLRQLGVGTE